MEERLEDNFEDILGKAARGLGYGKRALAEAAGLNEDEVRALLAGEWREEAGRKAAAVLRLDTDKLAALATGRYGPGAKAPEGLHGVTTDYGSMTVNAFVVWHPGSRRAAVFDTGAEAAPLIAFARKTGLTVETVAITHGHGDHVAALGELWSALEPRRLFWPSEEALPDSLPCGETALGRVDEGDTFRIGPEEDGLSVEVRRTSGHARGQVSYVVRGLAVPLALVGDSLFAGSMGGGQVSYTEQLENTRGKLLTALPEETIICPGHGPLTTIGQERAHNPFF